MNTSIKNLVSMLLVVITIFLSIAVSSAQTKKEYEAEIAKLKMELAVANQRAIDAQATASKERKASAAALRLAQKMAEDSRDAAQNAENSAMRARYIAQAKAMAFKSKELKDSQQVALVAQVAYKFNAKFNGNPTDPDIYNALSNALTRLNDHSTQDSKNLSSLSRSLCALLKRNMTREEWTEFVGDDLPYEKACDN